MKKLNVHAAPRRAVPPPYRPAPREHLIFSNHTRVHTRFSTNKAQEDEEKKSAHLLSTMILLFFSVFLNERAF